MFNNVQLCDSYSVSRCLCSVCKVLGISAWGNWEVACVLQPAPCTSEANERTRIKFVFMDCAEICTEAMGSKNKSYFVACSSNQTVKVRLYSQ
jgi:hypothetical protein